MKKKIVFLLSMCITFLHAQEAKTIENQDVIWYAYINSLQFSDKTQLNSDIQERHFVDPAKQNQFLIRTNLVHDIGKGWEAGGGAALFLTSRNSPENDSFVIPEIRPHFEINQKQQLNKITLAHRYRLELRYFQNTNLFKTELENGFTFNNYRFRYQIQAIAKLFSIDDHDIKIRVLDEIMLNFGEKVSKTIFDQNNIYAGLQYEINPHFAFEVGILKRFQQRSTAGNYFERDILRLTFIHRIKLYN